MVLFICFFKQISGDFSSVQDALYNVTGRLRDNLFSSTQNSAGTMNSSSLLPDDSPYGRMRDSAPLGFHTSQPVGLTHGVRRHTNVTQSMDHLGLSHTYDRPPSPPRSWTSQSASQANSASPFCPPPLPPLSLSICS